MEANENQEKYRRDGERNEEKLGKQRMKEELTSDILLVDSLFNIYSNVGLRLIS
jgi:hypothetical protein